ncbi:MAG: hypothetical protein EXR85_07680 [Xanthomonadales bacterium]|nr:hypothetical protein [Xanthomonadales bacterium]
MRGSKSKGRNIAMVVASAAIIAGIVLTATFWSPPWSSNLENEEPASASESNGIGEGDTPAQIAEETPGKSGSTVNPRDLLKDSGTKRSATDVEPSQAEADSAPASSEIVHKVLSAVESNNSAEGYEAYLYLKQCQGVAFTNAELDKRYAAVDSARSDPDTPLQAVDAFEATLESQNQMREQCRELYERKDEIDKRLEKKADEGKEVARFLYAMWSPNDQLGTMVGGELLWEYEATAFNYTLANLQEGHPLGLYAMGLSYSQAGYFTPQRFSLGSAFLLATKLCVSDQFDVQALVDQNSEVTAVYSNFSQVASEKLILATASRLYESYCAKSISNNAK